MNVKIALIGLITGLLLGGGWWAFFDGVVYAPDAFPWIHIVPPLGAMLSLITLNFTTLDQMREMNEAKVWAFATLTLGCMAVGGGIWITTVEYPPDIRSNWPGVSIIVQTLLTLFASILFFIGRSKIDNY